MSDDELVEKVAGAICRSVIDGSMLREALTDTGAAEALRRVKAHAWDEGFASGIAYQAGDDEAWRNPYTEAEHPTHEGNQA